MRTLEEAHRVLERATPPPRTIHIRLDDALGHVLAQDVVARNALPRFDNAAVDGYAVRLAARAAGASRHAAAGPFRVVGEAAAGAPLSRPVRAGEAVRILTGAMIPPGANTVVMQEHVERQDGGIWVTTGPRLGQHIRRWGEDIRRGTRVLAPGRLIRPQEIAILAGLGSRTVRVIRPPTVGIMVTGDELRAPGSRLACGQVFDSNGALLSALVRSVGAVPRRLGMVPDDPARLVRVVRRALANEVILVAGGVSVGDRDVVRAAMRACGVRELFWKVDIKPGMPFWAGRRGRRLVFGLPGNPVSVYVTFQELVRPVLERLRGVLPDDAYVIEARLADDLRVSRTRRTQFLRVTCRERQGRLVVRPLAHQGSHHLGSLVEAQGWIRVTSKPALWRAGRRVRVRREAV